MSYSNRHNAAQVLQNRALEGRPVFIHSFKMQKEIRLHTLPGIEISYVGTIMHLTKGKGGK